MKTYVLAALVIATSTASATEQSRFSKRQIVTEIDDAYDFVVIGGGLAGLVVGGRLSEDSGHSVLVLEAGGDGSNFENDINTPSTAYWGNLWDTELNWDFYTTAQSGLNGDQVRWPRGKVLGGSSAINGLYLTRPGEIEVNAWSDMLGDMDGAENWNWENFNAAMMKSETFTPPSAAIARTGGITYNAASRGTSGPLQASYPGWQSPINGDWASSAAAAGLIATRDAYGGDNWGAYICTSTIDPATWTRSYSRSAYLDPIEQRSNYDVMANAFVTRIIFDESSSPIKATAVEYTTDGGATKKKVNIKKEVILSAGSVQSPAVLQHSGIGPKSVLSAAGVDLVYELPGVGEHLQDHASVQMNYDTSIPTAGDIWENGGGSGAAFLSFVNDAVGFPGSNVLLGSGAGAFINGVKSSLGKYAPSDPTVAAGYDAIAKVNTDVIWSSDIGQVELLMAVTPTNSSVNLQITLQHPYSMGSVYIKSSDPTTYPVIDPGYLTNPADVAIFTAGCKLMREIASSGRLGGILTENSPGADTQSDSDWEAFIRGSIQTEFHPASTCAMLPKDQGGVVDANLVVYGTSNVRVADASIPPIEFSSHLMGSTYGIGEAAADIIKAYWKNPPSELKSSDTNTAEHSSSKARIRGGSHSSGGGDENSSTNTVVPLWHIIPASLTIAACIMFGF